MFLMKKRRCGFAGGMILGAVVGLSVGVGILMTNKTVRKEVNREFVKAKHTCMDWLDYMN